MPSYMYDFFVIGGGSGGLVASKAAAEKGLKVGMADFVPPSPAGTTWGLGGTCVNVGCIPKKLLHIAAQTPSQANDLAMVGWESKQVHNYETMITNVNNYIKGLNWGQKSELRSSNVKYYNKFARFLDANTLELENKAGEKETVTADKILIATGGRPSNGGYEGAELCIDSDDLFWRKKVPGKILVVGASYIALECAGFAAGFGFDTTVMVRSIFLRGFDQQMANMVGDYMDKHGVKFARKMVPTKFVKSEDGNQIVVHTDQGVFGTFDTVLLAIGRNGTGHLLDLEKAGVEYEKKTGKISANLFDETNVPNIFAIGDVVKGRPELTPLAMQAGAYLADRLFPSPDAAKVGRDDPVAATRPTRGRLRSILHDLTDRWRLKRCVRDTHLNSDDTTPGPLHASSQVPGKPKTVDYKNVATAVFTPLEYGVCGLSEEDARTELGDDCVIYHSNYTPLLWNLNPDRTNCFIKIIVNAKTDVVVGIHIVGPNAGEVIQGYGAAMKAGITKAQLDDTVGLHPTDAEYVTTVSQIKQEGVELQTGGGC
eukprot:GEMP01026283.1.p1 GENE.GEMP01026283.1~~GEMP01026283.1.p1  ORF type:complete len:541 (+),score=93.11 GEMP01026283.1:152-1774(+)